jgi:transposase
MLSDMSPEERVPQAHPLRRMRVLVDAVRKALSPPCDRRCSHAGRPSLAPAKLRRALLLQVRSTSRRERLLVEPRDDTLRLRWFVGWNMDDSVWDPSTLSKNRARLLAGDVAPTCCDQVLAQARGHDLLSDEPCTVAGTLLAAWAGPKRFQRKATDTPGPPRDDPGHPSRDCRGERRTHATHASTTDPAARVSKQAKGQEAKLASLGPVRMANRHGLGRDTRVPQATGTAAREAAVAMAEALPGPQRVTWGADKHDETRDGVRERRELRVTPHVAQHTSGRSSAIDGWTPCHPGDAVSQRHRQCGEAICGWLKPVGLLRKPRYRGLKRVGWMCTLAAAVYHLVRRRTLAAVACGSGGPRVRRPHTGSPPSPRGFRPQRLIATSAVHDASKTGVVRSPLQADRGFSAAC